jgi:hypothetical protein
VFDIHCITNISLLLSFPHTRILPILCQMALFSLARPYAYDPESRAIDCRSCTILSKRYIVKYFVVNDVAVLPVYTLSPSRHAAARRGKSSKNKKLQRAHPPIYRPCASFAFAQIDEICSLILVTSSMFWRLFRRKSVSMNECELVNGSWQLDMNGPVASPPKQPHTNPRSRQQRVPTKALLQRKYDGGHNRRRSSSIDGDVPFVVGDLRLELLDLLLVLPVTRRRNDGTQLGKVVSSSRRGSVDPTRRALPHTHTRAEDTRNARTDARIDPFDFEPTRSRVKDGSQYRLRTCSA